MVSVTINVYVTIVFFRRLILAACADWYWEIDIQLLEHMLLIQVPPMSPATIFKIYWLHALAQLSIFFVLVSSLNTCAIIGPELSKTINSDLHRMFEKCVNFYQLGERVATNSDLCKSKDRMCCFSVARSGFLTMLYVVYAFMVLCI